MPGGKAGEGQFRLVSGTFGEGSLCVKLGEEASSEGKKIAPLGGGAERRVGSLAPLGLELPSRLASAFPAPQQGEEEKEESETGLGGGHPAP